MGGGPVILVPFSRENIRSLLNLDQRRIMAIAVEEDADGLGLKLLEVGWLEISWGKSSGKSGDGGNHRENHWKSV